MPVNGIKEEQQWLVLAATILASGVSFLLGSMVTIALPVIQEAFTTGVSGIQWVFNAYLIGVTGLMLVAGPPNPERDQRCWKGGAAEIVQRQIHTLRLY